MPQVRGSRVLAAVYLLAVAGSSLVWAIQGAYSSAVLLTVVLTLPWSFAGYAVLYIASLALAGLGNETVATAVATPLIPVLCLTLALCNVLVARALWRTKERNRIRRESPTR
jgi:hypothetical protein